MVEEGTFREDLYFRLNVVTIFIPPLRERTADIPLLIEYYLHKICSRMNREVPFLEDRLMDNLTTQEWRGNVRQLRNCIEHMLVMNSSDELSLKDLPNRMDLFKRSERRIRVPDGLTMDELEKLAIKQALTRYGGLREQAARSLGISVRTLQRKLRTWRTELSYSD
jgi:DNA-binding NtrC family response regulator